MILIVLLHLLNRGWIGATVVGSFLACIVVVGCVIGRLLSLIPHLGYAIPNVVDVSWVYMLHEIPWLAAVVEMSLDVLVGHVCAGGKEEA